MKKPNDNWGGNRILTLCLVLFGGAIAMGGHHLYARTLAAETRVAALEARVRIATGALAGTAAQVEEVTKDGELIADHLAVTGQRLQRIERRVHRAQEVEAGRERRVQAAIVRLAEATARQLEISQEDVADLSARLAEEKARHDARCIDRITAVREIGAIERGRIQTHVGHLLDRVTETERTLTFQEPLWRKAALFFQRDRERMRNEMLLPSVQVSCDREVGSGTVIYSQPSPEGGFTTYVLTAYHVIAGTADAGGDDTGTLSCSVKSFESDTDGEPVVVEAEMVAGDRDSDLALLRLHSNRRYPGTARLLPREETPRMRVFSRVYAVGCPLGYAPMPTPGELSTTTKELNGRNYWMVSAPTIFGNSGGGIFAAESLEMIGVLSRVSAYNNLINIAVPHMGILVPIDRIHAWLEAKGYGFLFEDAVTAEGPEHGMETPKPVADTRPAEDGTTARAGLRR